jgi:PPOX class probable F420-dependent enzyme
MATMTSEHKKLVEGKNFAYVATLNKSGSPQVSPVWVDLQGNFILVNTAVGRVKAKNMLRDPRVAIAIADQSNPYSKILIQGRVIEHVTGKEAEDHIDKLAKKYLGQEKYPNRQPGEKRLLLKVEPIKISK